MSKALSVQDIFNEVEEEASKGIVTLYGKAPFNVKFNTVIEDQKDEEQELDEYKQAKKEGNMAAYPTLRINDKYEFFDKLANYVDLELEKRNEFGMDESEFVKAVITFLFVNASLKDFDNPVEYLNRRMDYLLDDKMNTKKEVDDAILGSKLTISRDLNSFVMETPYKMTFTLERDGEKSSLPNVYYGISDNKCYIYSIMNKGEYQSKLTKEVNRELYKLNDGIYEEESDEFKDYKDGKSDYYPENVSDVTPSFVFSTLLFLKELQRNGISDVSVVTYLPIRYYNMDANARSSFYKDEQLENNERIQNNATNKFVRTFMRCMSHLDGYDITSYPFEEDEYMHIKLSDNLAIKENTKVNVK